MDMLQGHMSEKCNGQDIVHGQEKIVDTEIELSEKEANYKEHCLECGAVCSRDLDIN